MLTRAALALLCAVAWMSPSAAFAQDTGLRGTTSETLAGGDQDTTKKPKTKKGAKKSKLAAQETAQPLARYQPADLNANSQSPNENGNGAPGATTVAGEGQVASQAGGDNSGLIAPSENVLPEASDTSTTNARAQGDDVPTPTSRDEITTAGRSDAVLASEIPEPFTRQSSDGSLQSDDVGRVETDNERTGSIEGKDIASETDPYAAPGIRAGTFILRPTLEAGVRYSNNKNDLTKSSAESKLLVRADSDWLRHSMNVEAEVNLQKGLSGSNNLSNGLRLAVSGQVDVTVADQITASASFERAREELDTSSTASFSERPIINSMRGSVGYTHDAGLISVGGTLGVIRQTFGDGVGLTGVTINQDDRDYSSVTGTLRASYELSPMISPFLEAEIGRKTFDNRLDSAGVANSSTRYALRAGSEINSGEKLNGELAGGWFVEKIDDPSLDKVSGFDLRGTLNWSPVRETTVALSLGTQVEGPRTASSSTSVVYSSSAEVTRKLRANLEASALLSASFRDFQGNEASQTTLRAGAGATWWFNRFAGIKGSVEHSTTLSSDAAGKRSATGVYVGVILRR